MVTIKVEEETLLNLIEERLKKFTSDEELLGVYMQYYRDAVYGGYYDNMEMDIHKTVDTDWFDLSVITKEEFDDYGIRDEHDEKILTHYHNLYLIAS